MTTWRNMSNDEKKPFIDAFNKQMAVYEQKITKYRQEYSVNTPTQSYFNYIRKRYAQEANKERPVMGSGIGSKMKTLSMEWRLMTQNERKIFFQQGTGQIAKHRIPEVIKVKASSLYKGKKPDWEALPQEQKDIYRSRAREMELQHARNNAAFLIRHNITLEQLRKLVADSQTELTPSQRQFLESKPDPQSPRQGEIQREKPNISGPQ